MKAVIVGSVFVVACSGRFPSEVKIGNPPPMVGGTGTTLAVPSSCPVYTPTGSDTGTSEDPFPEQVNVFCGVDSSQVAYGLITGDTGDLAIIPGGGEVGLYVDFADDVTFDLTEPPFTAWSAPLNVASDTPIPDHTDAYLHPFEVVAVGDGGILLSFGEFDGAPTQIGVEMFRPPGVTDGHIGYASRFYVNSVPPL
jgi:hypothetical protein